MEKAKTWKLAFHFAVCPVCNAKVPGALSTKFEFPKYCYNCGSRLDSPYGPKVFVESSNPYWDRVTASTARRMD